MNYQEAMDATVSREQMWRECARHGCDPLDLIAELGDHDTYRGADVLAWLGY